MKKQIQVYHHLGLGDHIICNGLIRELCTGYDTLYVFVKQAYLYDVSFMYRDEPKIELVCVKDDSEVHVKARKDIDMITIGQDKLDVSRSNFDESFYRQLGYEFSLRWDKFYVGRDMTGEEDLLNKLNPTNVPYIIVHDDPSRGLRIDLNKVRKDMTVVKVSDYVTSEKVRKEYERFTLFHWILALERAREIHCMDSAFRCLVESLPHIDSKGLFFHRYVKGKGPRREASVRKEWTVIENGSISFRAGDIIRRIYGKMNRRFRNGKRFMGGTIAGRGAGRGAHQ